MTIALNTEKLMTMPRYMPLRLALSKVAAMDILIEIGHTNQMAIDTRAIFYTLAKQELDRLGVVWSEDEFKAGVKAMRDWLVSSSKASSAKANSQGDGRAA